MKNPIFMDILMKMQTPSKVNLLTLPIAFLATVLAKVTVLPDMIFGYFLIIPIHELGHAIVAWLGGRMAIPIGAVLPMAAVTYLTQGRSALISVLVPAFMAYCAWKAYFSQKRYVLFLSLAFLGIYFRFRDLTEQRVDMWITYGGVGGEFALSALFITAFYYRLPDRVRWDFFRFPFLFAGVFTLSSAFWKWQAIAHRPASMPLGTFLGGSGDSGGDMDRLIGVFDWHPLDLIQSYQRLGMVCLAVVLGHYLWFLFRSRE